MSDGVLDLGPFDAMTFQDLIRTGNERGILRGDWTAWRTYREMRGKATPLGDSRETVSSFRRMLHARHAK